MDTMIKRTEKARTKAVPLMKKYDSLSFAQRLEFIKTYPMQWKKDHAIINRYYNLSARCEGYASGNAQAEKELNKTHTYT